MGLMDKIKEGFNDSYISIEDFILYLAFKLEEPVEIVVSWLLHNGFDKDINSYLVDKHYRVTYGEKTEGVDKNIESFFEQVSIDGYFNYRSYLMDLEFPSIEEETKEKYELSYDAYNFVYYDFFLSLKDLEHVKYLNELNLNFSEAKKYSFFIYLCDSVTARLKITSYPNVQTTPILMFSILDRDDLKIHSLNNSQTSEPIKYELIREAIELLANSEDTPEQNQDIKNDDESEESVNSRSQDKKLIAVLALLLASKSNTYQVGNKRPNATQISKAIYEFAVDDLKIAEEDLTGLKANINKISKAIQEYTDILYKRPE